MKKSFGFYGIVNPDVLALEGEYGPSLALLPPDERRNIAAALLFEDGDVILLGKRESRLFEKLSQLSQAHQLAAVRAIINTL